MIGHNVSHLSFVCSPYKKEHHRISNFSELLPSVLVLPYTPLSLTDVVPLASRTSDLSVSLYW